MEPSPKDGSVWFAKYYPYVPSGIVRFERGANPPETCKTEYYEPPKLKDGSYAAFGVRGVSVDGNGIDLGGVRQRPDGALRPRQMQGAARTDGHGAAVPGRLDLVRFARSQGGWGRLRQRGLPHYMSRGSTCTTLWGWARNMPIMPGQQIPGFAAWRFSRTPA